MKKKISCLGLRTIAFAAGLCAGVCMMAGAVWAKAISGQVISVNAQQQSVTVEQSAPGAVGGEFVTVHMKSDTNLQGFQSLEELETGDEIKLEANRKYFIGPWEANSIILTPGAEGQEVAAPAQAQVQQAGGETGQEGEIAFSGEQPSKRENAQRPVEPGEPRTEVGVSEQGTNPATQSAERSPTGAELMEQNQPVTQGSQPANPPAI